MSDDLSQDIEEMLSVIDARPPEDWGHILANALREYDRLASVTLIGGKGTPPVTWLQFIALGNHVTEPGFCMRPSQPTAEDLARMVAIRNVMMQQRLKFCGTEEVSALKGTGLKTAAIAMYGLDAQGNILLVLGRHPSLTLGQAACLILGALHLEEQERVSKN